MTGPDARPLIAHVIFRFDVGGLENGVVNLLNRMPSERFRHALISLTDITTFRERVSRSDVEFIALRKTPGHGVKLLPRLVRLFRRLRPTVVHTRNLAALETSIPAWLARVPICVHGEHGRDVDDLDGSNRTYQMVRRIHRPFVSHYVALSRDLERYMVEAIGVPSTRITRITNGVDTAAFTPRDIPAAIDGYPFFDPELLVFGTVGRLQPVKNQILLARAFLRVRELAPPRDRERLRLVIVGDGPARRQIDEVLSHAGASTLAWVPGARNDVAEIMRALDVFVLPSRAEGISNTILEAMASGLPVIATRVGGNDELVDEGHTGALVPSDDVEVLARTMLRYVQSPDMGTRQGRLARVRCERSYSLDAMVSQYVSLYDRLITGVRVKLPDARATSVHATPEGH